MPESLLVAHVIPVGVAWPRVPFGTIVEVRAPLTRSGKRAPLRQLRIEMRGYVRALRAGAEWDGRNLRGRRRAMRSLVEPGYAQALEQALDHLQHDERYRDTLEAKLIRGEWPSALVDPPGSSVAADALRQVESDEDA